MLVNLRSIRAAFWLLSLGSLTLVSATGCADNDIGQISGQVMIDGQPAKAGSITLIPVSGKGKTEGTTIADGAYSAKVMVGDYKVQIRVSKVVGKKKIYADAPDSPIQEVLAETLPPKYNDETELQITVAPGEGTHDFTDLQAAKRPRL